MPKRVRDPDQDSQSLIDELRANDELESIVMHSSNEKATIETLHKERLAEIESEFKTLDPETLSARDSLRLQQKLDYEEGLYKDQLQASMDLVESKTATVMVKHTKRKKLHHIDTQLNSAQKIASQVLLNASWHAIGKNRHLQHVLADLTKSMSSEQKETYKELMEDLKKNGWKIFKKD
jgi:hypothetical protein